MNLLDLNGNIRSTQKCTHHKGQITQIITSGKLLDDGIFITLSNDMLVMWSEVSLGKITKMNAPD
ncbi:hypothetical protein [Klebsiella pneumoniae]|uniref:hypothetical protein n=1 Tax=Klebsiella pneumoniae TaxID=573 RepID=UPI001E3091BD|nr:hypothetical protein [Klebsiella pneumoniae]MCC7937800.1 hypothetical protein [Klebsiella pneumoniae]